MADHTTYDRPRPTRTYGRETPEFARLVNLCDAVFAIAMTLLVLSLDVPDVPADQLAGALADDIPQLLAFLLGFALVANIWWQHHKLMAHLDWVEPGIVAVNLMLLGAVALVPFPTGLVGSAPTARAAVIPFIAVFIVLIALYVFLMERAHRVGAWSSAMPDGLFPWLVTGFAVVLAAMVLALAVAVWWPVGGLVLLAVSNLPERVVAHRAPAGYRDWA